MVVPNECPACGSGIYSYFGTLADPIALHFGCGAIWMPKIKWHITCPKAFAVLCDLYRCNNQVWQMVINGEWKE